LPKSPATDGFIAHPQVKVIYFERFVVESPIASTGVCTVTPLVNLIDAEPILPPIAPV
jgi:hypothetical protein